MLTIATSNVYVDNMKISLLVVMVGLSAMAEAPAKVELTVELSALRSTKGQVGCLLFKTASGFPLEPTKAQAKALVPITGRTATCVFSGLEPGEYALSAMHDENGNGELDRNFLGIPKEGVAFSNGARIGMGPPAFAEAKAKVEGPSARWSVVVRY